MNIWIVNHYADPPDGLSTRSFDLARRMVERGHRVTVFASVFSHYHFKSVRDMPRWRLWQKEVIDGVEFVWIRTWPYRENDWRRILNMVTFAGGAFLAGTLTQYKPDVVSGVTVHPLAALAGHVLAVERRARYVIEVTDLWPQSLIDMGRLQAESRLARGMRTLERYLYRRAEVIFMLWRNTQEYVDSLGVPSGKIVWLPHGIEVERYRDLQYSGERDGEKLRVMYLGGFVASMAIDVILDAARTLQVRGRDDICFLLVGAGTYRDVVIRRAAAMGLDSVTFPDPVPKAEVGRVMSQADAFIFGVRDLPLYKYGMSLNKLTDYLIAGRPIVYFGRSTYNPVEEADAGFTVAPDDAVAVADAVEQLADLAPAERARMGANGRQWAIEYHNIPTLTDRFLAALSKDST